MNKKGFTLIEVIATVIILVTICLVSFPVLRNTLKNNGDLKLQSFKQNAELAADTYLRLHKEEELNVSFGSDTSGISSYKLGDKEYYEIPVPILIKEKLMDKPSFAYNYKNDSIICSKTCEYGETDIKEGAEYTINDESYIVIRNSFKTQDYVVLMKKRGLSISDINTYGVGYINKYAKDNPGVPLEYTYDDGYRSGGVAYYSSSTCGYVNNSWVETDCKVDYSDSNIKHIIDNWSSNKFNNGELKEVDGYLARLITLTELKPYKVALGPNAYYQTDLYQQFSFWGMPTESGSLYISGNQISVLDSVRKYYPLLNVDELYESEIRPVINYKKDKLETSE